MGERRTGTKGSQSDGAVHLPLQEGRCMNHTVLPPADAYNDPYGKKKTAALMRVKFETCKKTEACAIFRRRQMAVQDYKCAYCQVDLRRKNIVVHIDHRVPLYEGGSNRTNNLLLTCRRCNLKKFTKVYGLPMWVEKRFRYRHRGQEQKRLEAIRAEQQE